MTNHRKTLQDGTPQQSVAPEVQRPQPAQPYAAAQNGHRAPPSSGADGRQQASACPSQIPPLRDEFRRTPPPLGTRTPDAFDKRPLEPFAELPRDAPGWMLRARRLSLAMEAAIRQESVSHSTEACIERAWAAWELDGFNDKQIARVAELMEKAHAAIRDAPPRVLEQSYHDIAQVISAGLPRAVKKRVRFDDLLRVTRGLRTQLDPWTAVVESTAQVLGWSGNAQAHCAHAIRVAIVTGRIG